MLSILNRNEGKRLVEMNHEKLESAYNEIVNVLNVDKGYQSNPTTFENTFFKLLHLKTKGLIYRSFWIGSRNVDFFIPKLTWPCVGDRHFKKARGLAIEIDGSVHFREFKMKKDQSKFNVLHSLNIPCVVIRNGSFNDSTVKAFIEQIDHLNRLDHRAYKRLMRDIYYYTIYKNVDLISQYQLNDASEVMSIINKDH